MDLKVEIPLLGFAAYSGTGKTTLLKSIIPILVQQGVRIGMIKHAHHQFEIDYPGKDSYELRKAGAQQMLIASSSRMALITELETEQEPQLDYLVYRLEQNSLDLILVEGFRHSSFPKIELHRPSLGKPLLCLEDSSIIALATDAPIEKQPDIPLLNLNNPEQITAFIQTEILDSE
jgi:molybdopterin-guanine dinucleotide biosynthesis protein B